ncbi:hypothetical protein CR513_27340, partial [Mucuna pruriens]
MNDHVEDNINSYVDMVMDATCYRLLQELQKVEEDPNLLALKFYNLLSDGDESLWDGCKKHTKFLVITQILNLKSEFNISVNCYNRMIAIIKITN